MANILFIDDDIDILEINKRYFTRSGYTVQTFSNSVEAIKLVKSFQPDCIILDIMMPGLNGFELCKKIRKLTTAPIIFLSGCSSEKDKVKGLITGADDYMVKPYSFPELSARIHSQLRRNAQAKLTSMSHRELTLDLLDRNLYYRGIQINLSSREYELMYLLMNKINQLVTYEEIGIHFWESYNPNDKSTIMVIASRLRKKLDNLEGLSNSFESIRSKGYQFKYKESVYEKD